MGGRKPWKGKARCQKPNPEYLRTFRLALLYSHNDQNQIWGLGCGWWLGRIVVKSQGGVWFFQGASVLMNYFHRVQAVVMVIKF